ncbi:glycosyltransferase family 2 protein [Limosilactobacillus vaginalis]|uniref:glycosyltransferase family 2 protein n=1 Tax=Limosilactobacillus vaginalis TaxID=1633 RepID=UPI0022A9E46D|nr:glycosyltransferase family A protein [Limosilactobacillus vaginalis]MCZ2465779.1 glycosyltransferase family 2 protein [Limosilactobacillus vaginalis]
MMLSVIIPSFNSQKTIIRAIQSCISCIENIEIIMVDDGSKDATMETVQKKYKKFIDSQRLRIISSNHSGAGNARNLGIQEAKGSWITFLDSDDKFLNLEMVIADLREYKNKRFDILNYSVNILSSLKVTPNIVKAKTLTRDNLGLNSESEKQWDSGPMNKVFKTNFLKQNNITFPNDIKIGEDLVFNQKCLQLNTNVLIKHDNIYARIDNIESITHQIVNQDILEDGIKLVQAVENLDIKDDLMNEFKAKNFISILVRFLKSLNSMNDVIFSLKQYKKKVKVRKAFLTFYSLKRSLNAPIILVSWIIWKQPNMARVLFPPMKKIKY